MNIIINIKNTDYRLFVFEVVRQYPRKPYFVIRAEKLVKINGTSFFKTLNSVEKFSTEEEAKKFMEINEEVNFHEL